MSDGDKKLNLGTMRRNVATGVKAERSSSPARVPWDPTQGDDRQLDGRLHPAVAVSHSKRVIFLVTQSEERPLGACSRSAACTSWGLAFGPEIHIRNSYFISKLTKDELQFYGKNYRVPNLQKSCCSPAGYHHRHLLPG